MRVRDLMLVSLGGGLLLGTVLGATTSTTMKPSPEPPWRQAAHGGSGYSEPVEAEQPDINSAWSAEDRTPTWKRHLPEYQQADFYAPPTLPEPVAEPAPEAHAPQTAAQPAAAADTVAEAPAEPVQAGA